MAGRYTADARLRRLLRPSRLEERGRRVGASREGCCRSGRRRATGSGRAASTSMHFYNEKLKKILSSKDIILYSVSSREIKVAIAERFIRTLKGKLFKYMMHQKTNKYIHILPDVIKSYNVTQHRGDHTPTEIHQLTDPEEIQRQFKEMYKIPSSTHKPLISTLPVGEYIRLSQIKPTFKKGYTIQNMLEFFKIARIDTTQSPAIYFLEDLQGEPIKGIFYREELIPTTPSEFYQIDIIRTKTVAGKKRISSNGEDILINLIFG